MDYIREINAFYDNDMVNHLSQSAGYLYLALLNIANRLFWKEGFMASDALLMARAGIKDRRTFRRAKDELVGAGLIESRRTEQGTTYTIRGLCCQAVKNTAKNVTSNAAIIAEKNTGLTINAATDAASIAGNNAGFSKKTAANVTFLARPDNDKSNNNGGSGSTQTKLNKLNQKETKPTGEDDYGSGNNSQLIAELVAAYRNVPQIESTKGDYPFIGALYNEYGYDRVLYAIHELSMAAVTTVIQKPLIYLRAILVRAGPGTDVNSARNNYIREENQSDKYERERYRG